ncbi:hypothetical protein GCM10022198_13240 [Klugiella xanthotipulae]|uniref:Ferredoxin-NADP reductase n=1 Tax=Klugiella xanthotipulae TaxID=244735 RepID=A0A543I4K3_9MICO|nr:oxidoreductase [Klugiella xanthotipulae]TQM65410.1 ferredoxin-NADP reductase [Klugiella xanthotipulae]
MRQLASLLGRLSMYRVVLVLLLALWVVSFGYSFLGLLLYTPIDLALSAAVAVTATVLSSAVLARIFRATAQWESAAITGMLIFFLFWPSADPNQLWRVALVGVVASLSKYILAWRGRHLFNPAAAAAFIGGLTQLTAAVWWLATPYLFPYVVVASFLVLYRTRRLPLALTFVAVAVTTGSAVQIVAGVNVGAAVSTVLMSYPYLFVAGFMLSEPLTLPARRYQEIVLAAVGGILVAVPFHLGPLYNSPELMLVLVNLAAAVWVGRVGIRLTYEGSRALSPSVTEFVFRPTRPLGYVPGQYLELTVPHRRPDARGTRRIVSFTSAPDVAPAAAPVRRPRLVTVAMSIPDRPSSAKAALRDLTPGTTLSATGVWGDYVLPRDTTVPVLLVAGGIGITPCVSQLRADAVRGLRRDVVLVYSARSAREFAYANELVECGVPVIAYGPESPQPLPAGWTYGGPGRVTGDLLAETVPGLAARRAYLSGPPAMVADLRVSLRARGVRHIHTDAFLGY